MLSSLQTRDTYIPELPLLSRSSDSAMILFPQILKDYTRLLTASAQGFRRKMSGTVIQIFGLPGSGKTTLSETLSQRINAVTLNADQVRADLSSDLGFTPEDRVEQARRLGAIARLLKAQGRTVIVDFVCPTEATRAAFGTADIVIWMNTITESRFADTNSIWETPAIEGCSWIFTDLEQPNKADIIISEFNLFDWSAPTTLQLGRYQPWHEGHQALKEEAHKRTDQVLVGVRNTYGTSEKDPLPYEEVERLIHQSVGHNGDTLVARLPNITNIVYGRDVGYKIEQVHLSAELQAISATQKRKELGI
jgi:cytidyltransferase-like protein